jgi:predicted methyltransferase
VSSGAPIWDEKARRQFRIRVILFVFCVISILVLLSTAYQAVQTLTRLDAVEQERDQWQRPSEILRQLSLKEGDTVVDLGCGAGYFTLKLSPLAGPHGAVLALDIKRLPLAFLWIRKMIRHQYNIRVIHVEPNKPNLPDGTVDAVLIANTYHELAHPSSILNSVFHALRSEARLVIVDRGRRSASVETRDAQRTHHELTLDVAEDEVAQAGFDIIQQQDRFIDRPGDEPWWLVVARKP